MRWGVNLFTVIVLSNRRRLSMVLLFRGQFMCRGAYDSVGSGFRFSSLRTVRFYVSGVSAMFEFRSLSGWVSFPRGGFIVQ